MSPFRHIHPQANRVAVFVAVIVCFVVGALLWGLQRANDIQDSANAKQRDRNELQQKRNHDVLKQVYLNNLDQCADINNGRKATNKSAATIKGVLGAGLKRAKAAAEDKSLSPSAHQRNQENYARLQTLVNSQLTVALINCHERWDSINPDSPQYTGLKP